MKQSGEFERTAWVRERRVFPEQLANRASSLVMTFRASMAHELEQAGCLDNAHCVWSLWPGYLDNAAGERMSGWLADRHIPLTVLHSSDHASVEDLQRLATAIHADRVIPIHTGAPDLYEGFFENVEQRPDGEWWKV